MATDGSIDWCCLPRFDSPAVFCHLLSAPCGGFFRIAPTAPHEVSRAFIGPTNVLATTFITAGGQVRVTAAWSMEPQRFPAALLVSRA